MAAEFQRSHSPAWLICQARIALSLACAGFLAACSTSLSPDRIETGSTSPSAPGAVANVSALSSEPGSDWDEIARVVGPSPLGGTEGLPWSNELNGHSGTVQNVVSSRGDVGQPCKTFMTTVSAVGGVQAYKATICKLPVGYWDYTTITPLDDSSSRLLPKG